MSMCFLEMLRYAKINHSFSFDVKNKALLVWPLNFLCDEGNG